MWIIGLIFDIESGNKTAITKHKKQTMKPQIKLLIALFLVAYLIGLLQDKFCL
jgi:hypothetical protein